MAISSTILPPPSAYTDVLGMYFEEPLAAPKVPDTSRLPALYALVEATQFTDGQATKRPARRPL